MTEISGGVADGNPALQTANSTRQDREEGQARQTSKKDAIHLVESQDPIRVRLVLLGEDSRTLEWLRRILSEARAQSGERRDLAA